MSRNFVASGEYVNCGDVSELRNTQHFTMVAWVYKAAQADKISIARSASDTKRAIGMVYYNDDKLYGFCRLASPGNSQKTSNAALSNPRNNKHLAIVYNGEEATSSNRLKMYDGASLIADTETGTIPSTSDNNALDFCIGRFGDYTGFDSDGNIGEVRIYSQSLTADQLRSDMMGVFPFDPVLYLPLGVL